MNTYPLTRPRRSRDDTSTVPLVALRERYHFLASYYRWCAMRPWPTLPGNDPITGAPAFTRQHDPMTNRMARAAYVALAREALAIAHGFGPSPLP